MTAWPAVSVGWFFSLRDVTVDAYRSVILRTPGGRVSQTVACPGLHRAAVGVRGLITLAVRSRWLGLGVVDVSGWSGGFARCAWHWGRRCAGRSRVPAAGVQRPGRDCLLEGSCCRFLPGRAARTAARRLRRRNITGAHLSAASPDSLIACHIDAELPFRAAMPQCCGQLLFNLMARWAGTGLRQEQTANGAAGLSAFALSRPVPAGYRGHISGMAHAGR